MPGTLFVVSTPIGNLGDLSARSLDTLRRAAVVACEDTRVTGKLLHRFGIRARLTSYYEHNEAERAVELLQKLASGDDVALVSDAGTPLVSDPGYRLVRAARDAGFDVRAIPGPSAVLAALAVSGLPTSRFTFAGFLPPKGRARETAVAEVSRIEHTIVLFEAGTRIRRLLSELAAVMGERRAILLREMTKLHEEHREGTLAELSSWARSRSFKGELTLVVGGSDPDHRREGISAAPGPGPSPSALAPLFRELRNGGLSAREAAKRLAKQHGLSSRDVYNELMRKRDTE
jgi:16S rRNA (cytidine1402-2'-O)-methyltransferase